MVRQPHYILIARPQITVIIEKQRVQDILTHSYINYLYLLFDQGLLWLYDEILHYANIIIWQIYARIEWTYKK